MNASNPSQFQFSIGDDWSVPGRRGQNTEMTNVCENTKTFTWQKFFEKLPRIEFTLSDGAVSPLKARMLVTVAGGCRERHTLVANIGSVSLSRKVDVRWERISLANITSTVALDSIATEQNRKRKRNTPVTLLRYIGPSCDFDAFVYVACYLLHEWIYFIYIWAKKTGLYYIHR